MYGFPKSARDNIREDEEDEFKKAAKHVLALSAKQIEALIAKGQFSEAGTDGQREEVPE